MKTFVILGMHRSATSLVAKGMSSVFHIGETILPADSGNPEGYWENTRFIELNDKILAAAGGSWDRPPSRESILEQSPVFAKDIAELVRQESGGRDLWGWKDPRTTLTVELYLPYLTNPHFVSCFRDPREVAMSLQRRDKFTLEFGLHLANEYNDRLLKFLAWWTGRLGGMP